MEEGKEQAFTWVVRFGAIPSTAGHDQWVDALR